MCVQAFPPARLLLLRDLLPQLDNIVRQPHLGGIHDDPDRLLVDDLLPVALNDQQRGP